MVQQVLKGSPCPGSDRRRPINSTWFKSRSFPIRALFQVERTDVIVQQCGIRPCGCQQLCPPSSVRRAKGSCAGPCRKCVHRTVRDYLGIRHLSSIHIIICRHLRRLAVLLHQDGLNDLPISIASACLGADARESLSQPQGSELPL